MTSSTEGSTPEDEAHPDQPVPCPAQIVPLGSEGVGSAGPTAPDLLGNGEDAQGSNESATSVDIPSGVIAQEDGVERRRSKRAVISVLAGFFVIEALALGFVAVYGAIKIADNPSLALARSQGIAPGEQFLSHLDLLRVVVFYLTVAALVAVMALAVKGLVPGVRRRAEKTTKLERICLTTAVVANLAAGGVAIAVNVQVNDWDLAYSGPASPERSLITTILIFAFFIVFGWGAVVQKDTPWRRLSRPLLISLGICAVIVAGQIAVQQASVGSYRYAPANFGPEGAPGFDVPLTAGFWTVSVVQHPASFRAVFASCGSPTDCVLFGAGYGDTPNDPISEVTVTTDAGRSWHSWLIPVAVNTGPGFDAFPTCTGVTCISSVIAN